MRNLILHVVGFTAGLMLALAPSCGPLVCSPATCSGCCDESQACHSGSESAYCGASGYACVSCGTNACTNGSCFLPVASGLEDGGIGGGFEGPSDSGAFDSGATDSGTTDSGTADAGAGYTLDDFCNDATSARCGFDVRCGLAQAQASCEDWFGRSAWKVHCGDNEKAAVKDGRTTFNPAAALACRDSLRNTASCVRLAPTTCDAAFTGAGAPASPCFDPVDCSPGSYCTATASGCPGTCVARKAAGATAVFDDECQAGLHVYLGKCAVPAAAGTSCAAPVGTGGGPQKCVTGFFCSSGNLCLAQGAPGAMCTDVTECQPNLQCVNRFCRVFAGLGQSCGGNAGACRFDLRCPPPGITASTCIPLGSADAGCTGTLECTSPLYCAGADGGINSGHCAPPQPQAGRCQNALDCGAYLYCDAVVQTCQPVKSLGQVCSTGQCGTDLTCTAGTCQYRECRDPTP